MNRLHLEKNNKKISVKKKKKKTTARFRGLYSQINEQKRKDHDM